MKSITVAKSWQELNTWQLQEIAHLYLNTKPEAFEKEFPKMVFILFQKHRSILAKMKLQQLLSMVPFSELAPYGEFLLQTTNFHIFPEISGLIKPADRLSNITVKQFSFADKFFDDWEKDRTDLKLRRFVASLYRIKEEFDELDLSAVAKSTDNLTPKEREAIALTYLFCRIYIWNKFPVVFPKPNPDEEKVKSPKFQKAKEYQSFDKIILGLVFSEEKPLGTKEEANATRIYEFLNVLSESILRYKEKERHANAN